MQSEELESWKLMPDPHLTPRPCLLVTLRTPKASSGHAKPPRLCEEAPIRIRSCKITMADRVQQGEGLDLQALGAGRGRTAHWDTSCSTQAHRLAQRPPGSLLSQIRGHLDNPQAQA